jgi:hypothetical protein
MYVGMEFPKVCGGYIPAEVTLYTLTHLKKKGILPVPPSLPEPFRDNNNS